MTQSPNPGEMKRAFDLFTVIDGILGDAADAARSGAPSGLSLSPQSQAKPPATIAKGETA
jgi:hypothetical protein